MDAVEESASRLSSDEASLDASMNGCKSVGRMVGNN